MAFPCLGLLCPISAAACVDNSTSVRAMDANMVSAYEGAAGLVLCKDCVDASSPVEEVGAKLAPVDICDDINASAALTYRIKNDFKDINKLFHYHVYIFPRYIEY